MKKQLAALLLFFGLIGSVNAGREVRVFSGAIIPERCANITCTPIGYGIYIRYHVEAFLKKSIFEAWAKEYFERKGLRVKKVTVCDVIKRSAKSTDGITTGIDYVYVNLETFD